MSISTNKEIFLGNSSNQESSLINSIRILSDFTIRDIKKIESANSGFRETYYSSSNGQIINKKIE